MDNLVISKIGQYLTISEIYKLTIEYTYMYDETGNVHTYFFQKYSNLFSQIRDYIIRIDIEQKQDIRKLCINNVDYDNFTDEIYADIESLLFKKLSKTYIPDLLFRIFIISVTRDERYFDRRRYYSIIEITKIQLSDSNNNPIKFIEKY